VRFFSPMVRTLQLLLRIGHLIRHVCDLCEGFWWSCLDLQWDNKELTRKLRGSVCVCELDLRGDEVSWGFLKFKGTLEEAVGGRAGDVAVRGFFELSGSAFGLDRSSGDQQHS
jgi:hypothetical protein